MAKSRFEYVREFERENYLLPLTHIVIRVDGKGFHKFSEFYQFDKPNDLKALDVMNLAALAVVRAYADIVLAYGDLDEYSFLLRKLCVLYERREMKLTTVFASLMLANYMYFWNQAFPHKQIQIDHLPLFDARAVVYPDFNIVRDYFSWRQVDCHINNLYNTTFWALVNRGNMSPKEAETRLMGTLAADKNEILFSQFGINYNNEPEMFKKGTILVREYEVNDTEVLEKELSKRQIQRRQKSRKKADIVTYHIDMVKDDSFWNTHPYLNE